MYQSGVDIQSIIDGNPNASPDFVAIELDNVRVGSEGLKKALALVAFGKKAYTVADIARILSLEESAIKEQLSGLGAVEIYEAGVSFVSEAHRKFTANLLRNYREAANKLIIDDLLKDADSDIALDYLPTAYEESERLDELLEYLTPEHFAKILERSGSLSSVQRRADLGFTAAQRLDRHEDMLRFSMHKSVITELSGAEIWRSEIEARMALKDYDAAFALAQSTVLKEDRFHLLIVIGKMKKEHGLTPEPELLEQIRLLYDQIDPRSTGDRAIDIASDLIAIDPDLAVRMIEEATASASDKSEIDWAFATLSIAALDASRDQPNISDAAEKARAKITDPKAQEFSSAASVFFGEYSAAQVIEKVSKLEPKNRLFFLRHWAISNREKTDAADVIDYSLDLLV